MTERGHDALLGSAEGTASHETTVASRSKRFGSIVMPPAPTPQDGAKPTVLIREAIGCSIPSDPGYHVERDAPPQPSEAGGGKSARSVVSRLS